MASKIQHLLNKWDGKRLGWELHAALSFANFAGASKHFQSHAVLKAAHCKAQAMSKV